MKIMNSFLIMIFLALMCTNAHAQYLTQASARSLGMGGGAESLCDDVLSMLDNVASMGRNARERGQLGITFGMTNYYDYNSQSWEVSNSLLLANLRIVIAPEREAENGKWAFWYNSASPPMTWVGILTDANGNDNRVEARSSIKELGLGFGIELSENFHMGLGVGATVVFAEWDSENLSTGNNFVDNAISFLPIPVGHIGFEFFVLPEFNISLNALISGFNDTDVDSIENIRDIEASYLSGPGVLQVNFSMAYEFSPFFHISGGYQMTMMNVPDWASVHADFDEMIHSASIGAEYIILIGGTSVQIALRFGAFAENFLGTSDIDADYLLQIKKGLRAGIALKLGDIILETSLTAVLDNEGEFNLNRDPFYVSLGFLF